MSPVSEITLRLLVVPLLTLSTALPVMAGNWPAWRGTDGTGRSSERNLPVSWSPTDNVTWKTSLPGEGNSTPITWDDRVFLTCPVEGGKVRRLICLDRNNGKVLWKHDVPFAAKETTHRDNPFCSGSPTTDGKRVYASFGSAGVLACDFQGHVVWHRKLGKLTHVFGQATTPVLYKNLVIVHRGPGIKTHLVALDKQTGKTVWDTPEFAKNSNLYGSWSTPVIIQVAGRDELVVTMPREIKGYDPANGKELWKCGGLGTEIYTMPTVGNGLVVGISGHQGPAMAVKLGGRGDLTESNRLWLTAKNQQRVGSGVIVGDHLYVSNATGIAQCIEARSGKVVWAKRLGGTLWGTMLAADGRLYVSNKEGDIFVLAAAPEFKLLARNRMAEHMKAAVAPSDGQLFVRTYKSIYCIGTRTR
ncbi:MAG: PQQ-binding-like beta-propeller repeat protein [Planctomycetota bacterium]|nr:PQQ-binding-like beta-propeller repeat protein [Planctomycetota bacterium]